MLSEHDTDHVLETVLITAIQDTAHAEALSSATPSRATDDSCLSLWRDIAEAARIAPRQWLDGAQKKQTVVVLR